MEISCRCIFTEFAPHRDELRLSKWTSDEIEICSIEECLLHDNTNLRPVTNDITGCI